MLTHFLKLINAFDVQLKISGDCQPSMVLSHKRDAFPSDPLGHDSIAGFPNSVWLHQIPSAKLRGQPSYTTEVI